MVKGKTASMDRVFDLAASSMAFFFSDRRMVITGKRMD